MDNKNTYETYEYLSVNNNSNTESEFFVVQEDGTFLINRQVQYVAAQVQDKKEQMEGVQSCTVYDVPPQPFFIDVENSAQLISVPDNFILPDGANNISAMYGNNYFLQAVSSTGPEQVEQDVEQFKETGSQETFKETEIQETDADIDMSDGKQNSICTEITLSDEQYNMLEQKGWLLLETTDKVFLLDTLGLHDITNNQGLIEQLQAENRSREHWENDCSNKIPNVSPATENTPMEATIEQETVEFVIDDDCSSQNEENVPETTVVADSEEAENNIVPVTENNEPVETKINPTEMARSQISVIANKGVNDKPQIRKDNSTVTIKTKFLLKDIPDKIVLGKTVNGKKLVAKVVRPVKTDAPISTDNTIIDEKPKHLISKVQLREDPLLNKTATAGLAESLEWQFGKMVREALHCGAGGAHAHERAAAARDVVAQLLQVPAFKLAILARGLVITKSVRNKVDNVETESMVPGLVTGRVTSVGGENHFVHIPDLLGKLMSDIDSGRTTGSLLKQNVVANKAKDNSVLHVHVTETRRGDTKEGVSITLNKRHLEPFSDIKPKYERMYACSACANIFESETELMDHRENQCVDSEDSLTIDTDDLGQVFDENIKLNPYYILKSDKGTMYACLQCPVKFNKLSNCQRHIKTHAKPVKAAAPSDKENEKQRSVNEPTFQCKMCSSAYYHPSSLSKHIVAAHISSQVISN